MALVGATLVDGTGAPAVPTAVDPMRESRITCAGPRATSAVPPDADAVSAIGKWIIPGLIDTHVHFSQTGWVDGRPDALDLRDRYPYDVVEAELHARPERFFRSYLCSGVTSVFDVGGYPWTLELQERTARSTRAPRVRAAGSLLSTIDFWLNLPDQRQFIYMADEGTVRQAVRAHKTRSEEHTSELQSQSNLVCRLLLEKKKRGRHARRSRRETHRTAWCRPPAT